MSPRAFVRLASRAGFTSWLATLAISWALIRFATPGFAGWLDRNDVWGDYWFVALVAVGLAISYTAAVLSWAVRQAASRRRGE